MWKNHIAPYYCRFAGADYRNRQNQWNDAERGPATAEIRNCISESGITGLADGSEKYELMYSYAANRRTIYKKVLIPSCIPYFFTGLKIAAPMAITASILVDTLQGDGGLGCMLSQSLKHAMSIYVFWDIVLVSGS